MATNTLNTSRLSTPRSLRVFVNIGVVCATIAILIALIGYLHRQPDLSLFITYLSDIRVTPAWPGIGLITTPTY
jgi:hypothetical protein